MEVPAELVGNNRNRELVGNTRNGELVGNTLSDKHEGRRMKRGNCHNKQTGSFLLPLQNFNL